MDRYDTLIRRVRALAEDPDLSDRARDVLGGLLDYHDEESLARETAEGYLAAAERHVEAYRVLQRRAEDQGVPVARLDAWPEWREAAELLAATGQAILSNEDGYGAYLDAMTIGKARARLTVEQLRSRLQENRSRSPTPDVRTAAPARVDARAGTRLRPHSGRPREAARASREGREAGPQARQVHA